jgi:hypothetical protein
MLKDHQKEGYVLHAQQSICNRTVLDIDLKKADVTEKQWNDVVLRRDACIIQCANLYKTDSKLSLRVALNIIANIED